MTLRFADQFKSYLYRRGQSNETASKYMQCIKRFLSWCHERGIIKQTEWKKSEFGVPRQQKVQHVALTEEEVARLSGLDLSGTDKSVRDLFLWMCYTGQRWSDVERLRPDAVQNGVLIYHPWKTRARSQVVRVPLVGWSAPAAEIFERIKKSRAVCSQVFNRRLKTLCQQAEINAEFVRTRRSGSKETTEVFETWQMVSAHTGRRTFATVLLTRGVPVNVVAKLTGHRSLKTLEKYEQASTDYALQQYIQRFS
jgi:integrase